MTENVVRPKPKRKAVRPALYNGRPYRAMLGVLPAIFIVIAFLACGGGMSF